MQPGDLVRFRAHGPTGLEHKVIARDGDDLMIQDSRGRLLRNTPVELLEPVAKDVAGSTPAAVSTGAGCNSSDGERGSAPSQVDRREEQPPSSFT